jgi:DNA-binding CsgD family transcriptional regulator
MEAERIVTPTKNILLALAVACIFGAVFIVRPDLVAPRGFTSITVFTSAAVMLLGITWISYYRAVNMWALVGVLIALLLIEFFVVGDAPGVFVLSTILQGCIYALSIALLGSLLFLAPEKHLRSIIILGTLGSILIFPLLHLQAVFDVVGIQQVLLLLTPLVVVAFMLLEKGTWRSFSPASQPITQDEPTETPLRVRLFSQEKTNLITLATTIPFFICCGLFRGFSLDLGVILTSNDALMGGIALMLLVLFIVDKTIKTATWLTTICFIVEGLYMVFIFIIMYVSDFPLELLGVMRAVIHIVQVWILITLSEIAIEKSLSPVFLSGTFAIVYFFPQVIGDFTAFLFSGTESFGAPMLVGGGLMTIAVVAWIIILLLVRNKHLDVSERELLKAGEMALRTHDGQEQEVSADENLKFAEFCSLRGITEKEKEVIRLYSRGRSVSSISKKLFVSESTVRTYIQRVYEKLSIHSRQELLDAIEDALAKA